MSERGGDRKPGGSSFADLFGADPEVDRIERRHAPAGRTAPRRRRPGASDPGSSKRDDEDDRLPSRHRDDDADPVPSLHRGDVPPSEFADLRSGRVPPGGRIDLHGLDRAGAQHALRKAFGLARAQGTRCMLVVHGRGRHSPDGAATLKGALPGWLCSPPLAEWVRGFAPALPRDGGDGASYVLLRLPKAGPAAPRTRGPKAHR